MALERIILFMTRMHSSIHLIYDERQYESEQRREHLSQTRNQSTAMAK